MTPVQSDTEAKRGFPKMRPVPNNWRYIGFGTHMRGPVNLPMSSVLLTWVMRIAATSTIPLEDLPMTSSFEPGLKLVKLQGAQHVKPAYPSSSFWGDSSILGCELQ